jgi:hypothetical protein
MTAAARPTTCRRRARRRRRLLIVLLVALFTLALGAGVDAPQGDGAPSLMALAA